MPDFTAWMLVFVRVGAVLAVMPLYSNGNVPILIRLGIAALTSFLISSLLDIPDLANPIPHGLMGLVFIETATGLLLGFLCRFVFYAIETAGSILANELGLSMSFLFNPGSQGMVSSPGMILHWLATMIFLSLDLHVWLIWGLKQSYTAVPIGTTIISAALANDVLRASGCIFVIALQIAAPVLAVSLIANLVFALLGRLVPQMNVFSESFSFRVLAGLMVFGVTCTVMAEHIMNNLRRIPADFQRALQLMTLS